MWQYQNTDELYHANMYKNINKNSEHELYHSDVYLGKDFSDGIKHWKYIKREKVNGRWRYYYKNDKLDQLGREKSDALETLRAANKVRGYGDDTSSYHILKGKRVGTDKAYRFIDENASRKSMNYASEEYKDRKRRERYDKYVNALNTASEAKHKAKQKIKQKIDSIINKIKSRKTKGKA